MKTTSVKKEPDERDKKILYLLFQGKTAKQIGNEIFISSRTVENRLRVLRENYECRNNVQLTYKLLIDISENTENSKT